MIARSHEGSREFEGVIDEVKIWNRILSEKEVNHHMTVGKGQVSVESRNTKEIEKNCEIIRNLD